MPARCRQAPVSGNRASVAVGAHRALLCPQLADVVDSEVLQVYMKSPAHEESKAPSKGFVVRDAPWTASSSEKVGRAHPGPSLGLGGGGARRTCLPVVGPGSEVGRLELPERNPLSKVLPSLSPQAPDMSSSEEFPSFGAQVAPKTLPWGPKR